MTPRTGPVQRACGTCGDSGTVQVEITNTQTGHTQVLTQTCTDCL